MGFFKSYTKAVSASAYSGARNSEIRNRFDIMRRIETIMLTRETGSTAVEGRRELVSLLPSVSYEPFSPDGLWGRVAGFPID